MRTVTATALRAERGSAEHTFSSEISRARTSTEPVQITRQTGRTDQREPARLIGYDQWTSLRARSRPKKLVTRGAREARTHLRDLLDAALIGTHTVVTVDGVPYAVIVPTKWHKRITGETAPPRSQPDRNERRGHVYQ